MVEKRTRRSSARIASTRQTTSSSPNASSVVISRAVQNNEESEGDSDIPEAKRRRTQASSSKVTWEVTNLAESIETSATTSIIDSEVATPETPATLLSDSELTSLDEESKEDEEPIRRTRAQKAKLKAGSAAQATSFADDDNEEVEVPRFSRAQKGKGKEVVEDDIEEESVFDDGEEDTPFEADDSDDDSVASEYDEEDVEETFAFTKSKSVKSRSRQTKTAAKPTKGKRNTKGKVVDEDFDSPREESDWEFQVQIEVPSVFKSGEKRVVAPKREGPPYWLPEKHHARWLNGDCRRLERLYRPTRAEKDRQSLYSYHPELEYIWKKLDETPKIEVAEAAQPVGLSLKLLPFQREGLHWLIEQEKTEYRGGILGDEMGMGKTIQTIALLLHDSPKKPNLVVAPVVALIQWRDEIAKFTNSSLSVLLYHGSVKAGMKAKDLAGYDVVLTSYNQLESVYRKQHSGFKRKGGIVKEASVVHKVDWHRVILDEAHSIKSRQSNTARAVFALKTNFKLCLSGTPLQNRIGELFSLLRFLEVDPFSFYYCRKCDCKQQHWSFSNKRTCDHCNHAPMSHTCFFNYECLKPIQQQGNRGEGKIAFENIRLLVKHIMLRRTKNEREEDLGLPPKVIRIRRDKFSEEEVDLYDSIYGDSKRKFNTYVAQGVILNNYANIFTLITRMRQMADHPDLVLRKHSEQGQNTLVCVLCDDAAEDAIKAKCHHTYCRSCAQQYLDSYGGTGEPECVKCHISLSIDLTQSALEADELAVKKNSILNRIDMTNWRSSTKIEALCEELQKNKLPHRSTKSIVFSQFTSMLQLIEWRLHKAGFKTTMLEGSMTPAQRDATIKHFMEDVSVEVFLVSLKAGGVALNLIEANNVYIVDPWWNPAAEAQAADRIHRIGQTRPCQVTRLVIQDSIESRIIELQEKKQNMIDATVGVDEAALDKLSPADMQFLFQN